LRVDSKARVTSDGGLILVRELDERLGLSELMGQHLSDSRLGKNIQLSLAVGAAQGGRHLVGHQLAAAAGENRRPFNQTRPLLLVIAGGEPSDATALRQRVGEDCGAAFTSGIDGSHSIADFVIGLGEKGISV